MLGWILHTALAPAAALLLLVGLFTTSQQHLTPADAGDYHQRVAEAVEAVPYRVGDWLGKDVPVPTQAIDLLQPNAILSRQYVHLATGRSVSLLIVQTPDARQLYGHYPPVCYPGAGWTLAEETQVTPKVTATGTGAQPTPEVLATSPRASLKPQAPSLAAPPRARYRFRVGMLNQTRELCVDNILLLPDGSTSTSMAMVGKAAGSHLVRHLGAAQIQLVTVGQPTPEEQNAIWAEFLPLLDPVAAVIGSMDLPDVAYAPTTFEKGDVLTWLRQWLP